MDHNTNTEDAKRNTPDIETTGNPDMWVLLCKATSDSGEWTKSTKAMELASGCLVQVSTKQGEHVAEALTWVPGTKIITDEKGIWRLF